MVLRSIRYGLNAKSPLFVLDKINRMPYSFLRVESPQGGFSNNIKLAKTNKMGRDDFESEGRTEA